METMAEKFNPRALDRIQYEHQVRSDRALAKLLGVNASTLHRWRQGDGSPSFAAVVRMKKLGISLDQMVLGNADNYDLAASAA